MNKVIEWLEKPTEIKTWEKDINYVMFVDESGTSDLTNILKCISQRKEIDISEKIFTITGCIFTQKNYKEAKEKINELKNKYWKDGKYTFKGKTKKVCFHSREIRKRINAFDENLINYDEFIKDLSTLMDSLNYTIISINIDKEKYLRKGYTFNTYNTAMCFLIQRYIYVMPNHSKGLIMLEARGKKEDKMLLTELKHIIFDTGIKSILSTELQQKIAGIYFNPKWNKEYDDTFTGIEVADLSSYPIHKYVRNNVKDKAFELISNKFDKYPDYINKGLKMFP